MSQVRSIQRQARRDQPQPPEPEPPDLTMPYAVAFRTLSLPDPQRLGTAHKRVAQILVWAKNADEAIEEVKRLCGEAGREYLETVSVDVPTNGIARELIFNDELCTVSLKDLQ